MEQRDGKIEAASLPELCRMADKLDLLPKKADAHNGETLEPTLLADPLAPETG